MKKAICFGASGGGIRLFEEISNQYEIIAFTDNDERKWNGKINNVKIVSVKEAFCMKPEVFVITSEPGLDSIKAQLQKEGILDEFIITTFVEGGLDKRRKYLENLSQEQQNIDKNVSVAEVGVFAGDFAKWINHYYFDRTLYLFDTFEGFAEQDLQKEVEFSEAKQGDYSNTTIELVMGKMPYKEKVKIYKGYFPETAKNIEEQFCFVNLDVDLYEPTYQGLLYFEKKMVKGGVILVHDYFATNFRGPKKAVDQFIAERKERYQVKPIEDGISVMITGFDED